MIKYLIIDDEHVAHDIIKGYCDMMPNLALQKNCYNALEALAYLSDHKVDLIFLDINMPKLKGFDFLKSLTSPPKVIVTTAYQEFALEGFELNVVDYLLKPFSFERFIKAVNKAIDSSSPIVTPLTTTTTGSESLKKTIFIRSDKKHTQVVIEDIQYIEAAGNYTKVVTEKETITTREKISTLLKILVSDDFIQVHKSFAVAAHHINSIEGNRIFIAEHTVPIGKLYKRQVNAIMK